LNLKQMTNTPVLLLAMDYNIFDSLSDLL
jgi:hypothetical protein